MLYALLIICSNNLISKYIKVFDSLINKTIVAE